MLQIGRSLFRFQMVSLEFFIDIILSIALGPGVDSAANRNEHQDNSWGENNNNKLYTVLSYLGVFTFRTCCKILICLVCIVASFKLSCV